MLGSVSEADDAVQEAWLRLSRTDTADESRTSRGWLTTVVARVSPRHAAHAPRRAARSRSSPHVPEPSSAGEDAADPEHEALLADSVGLALLVVLETPRSGRAPRLRPARHVRRALRRDRPDRRPLADRRAPAREPRAAPGPGRGAGRRTPTWTAQRRGRRRLPRRRARRRLRRARRRARPRRRAAGRLAAPAAPRRSRSAAPRPWPRRCAALRRGWRRSPGRRSSTARPGSSWSRAGGRSRSLGVHGRRRPHRRDRRAGRPGPAARAGPDPRSPISPAPGRPLRGPRSRVRTSPPATAISSSSQRKLNPATSGASSGATEIPLVPERPTDRRARGARGRRPPPAGTRPSPCAERPEVQAHAARTLSNEEWRGAGSARRAEGYPRAQPSTRGAHPIGMRRAAAALAGESRA